MTDEYISEQRRQYVQKNFDKTSLRNPSMKCSALHFMKPFEDAHLRFAPKALNEPKSVYKTDFIPVIKDNEEKTHLKWDRSSVEKCEELTIDRSKPSYSKLMDSSATSNRLSYYHLSFDQQRGIGANDNITFWNWIRNEKNKKYSVSSMKQDLRDKLKTDKYSARCSRRGEFQILQNSVPNSGLTTETKSNFKKPDSDMEFSLECIRDQIEKETNKFV